MELWGRTYEQFEIHVISRSRVKLICPDASTPKVIIETAQVNVPPTMSYSRPELKIDDEGGFIKFFRNLESMGEECIRIFDRNDYYTAHGDDAVFIATTVCIPWT